MVFSFLFFIFYDASIPEVFDPTRLFPWVVPAEPTQIYVVGLKKKSREPTHVLSHYENMWTMKYE